MKMTENEKIIGIETMKSRIEIFHTARLKRIGMECKMKHFKTLEWSRAEIIREFRGLPENDMQTTSGSANYEIPTPKTEREMREIVKVLGVAITMG